VSRSIDSLESMYALMPSSSFPGSVASSQRARSEKQGRRPRPDVSHLGWRPDSSSPVLTHLWRTSPTATRSLRCFPPGVTVRRAARCH
jgi:hypothetical protein